MPAPVKVWMVFPSVLNTTVVTPLTQHLSENAAEQAAFKASVTSGVQYMIFEAISYVEPIVPQQTVDALILPIA